MKIFLGTYVGGLLLQKKIAIVEITICIPWQVQQLQIFCTFSVQMYNLQKSRQVRSLGPVSMSVFGQRVNLPSNMKKNNCKSY